MTGAVIGLGGIQGRISNGSPVRLDDGREGWVYGCTFARIKVDEPITSEMVTGVAEYTIRLTSGRGFVSKPAAMVRRLARDPMPATTFKPLGAA